MRRIALAIGDPNGIGPEIAVKAAFHCAERRDGPMPILVGDHAVIAHYASRHAAALPLEQSQADWAGGKLNVAPMRAMPPGAFRPGAVTAEAGAATIAYMREALRLVREGSAYAIVGAPHNETAVARAGIDFSGYPSLLADLLDVPRDQVFLMLVGGGLRIVHATLHESMGAAMARLTPELVAAAGLTAARALIALGIALPRIGVFGFNPHAGEGGLFGSDDARVTEPAVVLLRAAGVLAEGPMGADTMLVRGGMDAYVAIFHDQGHIPVKLLAPRHAAALSIGAGVIFSSVGHGSAHDIAGQGIADPAGVVAALELLGGTVQH
jgi:4-hydroxythreonine-4-phosphate dehydrogenase